MVTREAFCEHLSTMRSVAPSTDRSCESGSRNDWISGSAADLLTCKAMRRGASRQLIEEILRAERRQRNRLVVQTRLVRCHVARRDKNFLTWTSKTRQAVLIVSCVGGSFRGQPPTELGGAYSQRTRSIGYVSFLAKFQLMLHPFRKNRSYRS